MQSLEGGEQFCQAASFFSSETLITALSCRPHWVNNELLSLGKSSWNAINSLRSTGGQRFFLPRKFDLIEGNKKLAIPFSPSNFIVDIRNRKKKSSGCCEFSHFFVNNNEKLINYKISLFFVLDSAASLLSAMNRTAAPCVDFFQYACGTWNRVHVIPEDRSSISTFEVLSHQLKVILKQVLEEPPNSDDNEATLKAKMFYKSCMHIRGYNDEESFP